jgi:hypothetical protein
MASLLGGFVGVAGTRKLPDLAPLRLAKPPPSAGGADCAERSAMKLLSGIDFFRRCSFSKFVFSSVVNTLVDSAENKSHSSLCLSAHARYWLLGPLFGRRFGRAAGSFGSELADNEDCSPAAPAHAPTYFTSYKPRELLQCTLPNRLDADSLRRK